MPQLVRLHLSLTVAQREAASEAIGFRTAGPIDEPGLPRLETYEAAHSAILGAQRADVGLFLTIQEARAALELLRGKPLDTSNRVAAAARAAEKLGRALG